uniref:EGF-like domain-containing protein n=1 Tax=Panagrolaimus superbus TaxID=310955 RepID=A0A914YQL8_9BILA
MLFNFLLLALAVLGSNGNEWLDASSCKNGGTPTNTTDCICFEYFTGSDCGTIKCLNQGYLSNPSDLNADRCICPVGYFGLFCESYQQAPAQTDLFLVKTPDLIIFLNTRVQTLYNTFQFYKNAVLADPAISRGLNGNYSKYFLYEFDNEDPSRTKSLNFDNRNGFLTEFNRSDLTLRSTLTKCSPEPLFKTLLPWIKDNKFSQQTINIFTQLPSTTENFEELENLAIAFNLQFNIYFQYTDVLCHSDKTYDTLFPFELLAQRTGGFYWPFYQFDDSANMVTDLVRSTFNLQLLGYQAYADGNCPTSLSATFNHALGPVDIYTLVKSASSAVSINSSLSPPISTTAAATGTTFISLFPPFPQGTVTVTGATGACSIEILGIKRNPLEIEYLGIKAYLSFTDSIDADSSYFAMKSGVRQYIRLHLENIVSPLFGLTPLSAELSSDCKTNISTNSLSKSPSSTFDYISSASTNCLDQYGTCMSTKHWLTVTFSIQQVQNTFTVIRHIPIKCLSSNDNEVPTTEAPATTQPMTSVNPVTTVAAEITTSSAEQQTTTQDSTTETPTTEAPTTSEVITTEAATTVAQETTEAASTVPSTPFACPNDANLPAMIIGYSMQYDAPTVRAFLSSPLVFNSSTADPNYGHYVIFTTDSDSDIYDNNHANRETFSDFQTLVTSYSAAYQQGDPNRPTNVISILKQLLSDPLIKDRSAIFLLIGKTEVVGDENDKIEIMQLATSKQIRVNFYIDKALYQSTADPEIFKFYEQVSAISNGHFIIADVNKSTPGGFYVPQKIFSLLFFDSFPHKLAMSKTVSIKGADDLGTLDLSGQTGDRDFFITAAYSPYTNDVNSVYLMVIFTNKNGGQSPGPFSFVCQPETCENNPTPPPWATCSYGNVGCGAMLSIPAGVEYDITIINTIYNENSTLTYRLWEHWQDNEEYKIKNEYMDVRSQYQSSLSGPIYEIAAVPKVALSQFAVEKIDKLEVEFYDCDGKYVYTYDHYNYASVISNDSICGTTFMVNPFICNFEQTCSLERDILQGFYTTKYKIRTTDNTVLQYSTNFWCKKNEIPMSCPNADPTAVGLTSTVPSTDDVCQCLTRDAPHLRGPVCTVSDCSKNGYLQYDSSEEDFVCQCKDGYNGTYCEIGICSNTASRTAKDVNYRTFTIAIVHSNRDEFNNIVTELQNANFGNLNNIWQFNVFTVCNGNTKTRYFGTSKDTFTNILAGFKSNFDADLLSYCGSDQGINFTSVVKYGLNSFGKEVRGVFWIATHNSDIVEVDSLMDFYHVVQGYRQEIFLTAVLNVGGTTDLSSFNTTLEAVRVTGGERIDFGSYAGSTYAKYIENIVLSKTSLNYYDLITDSITNVEIPIEESAYLTISNGGYTDGVTVTPNCVAQPTVGKAFVYLCSTPGPVTVTANIQDGASLVTVRVLNGYTPAWVFINETNQDNLEAMPVLNTYPSIAFDFEDNNVIPHDTTPYSIARQAERVNCAFKYTSTFQLPVTSTGYDNFEITIEGQDYKKIIPYVITETLENRCKNGNVTIGDAKCTCPEKWSGADCSRPICEYGSLNIMQNACYCDLTHGGQTCSAPQLMGY